MDSTTAISNRIVCPCGKCEREIVSSTGWEFFSTAVVVMACSVRQQQGIIAAEYPKSYALGFEVAR